MSFINAKITEKDRLNYGLDNYDKPYFYGVRHWAVDQEKKMFLVKYWEGHELGVDTHISTWFFGISNGLVRFTKHIQDYKKVSDKYYSSKQKIIDLDYLTEFEVDVDKEYLINRIIEAMQVYQEGGVYAKMEKYDLTVDVSEVL